IDNARKSLQILYSLSEFLLSQNLTQLKILYDVSKDIEHKLDGGKIPYKKRLHLFMDKHKFISFIVLSSIFVCIEWGIGIRLSLSYGHIFTGAIASVALAHTLKDDIKNWLQ
ncbi:hypothetical protein ACFL0D_07095, partial [Thermoproteota archaeon]